MQDVYEACDVEGGEHGQHFLVRERRYLLDLKALRYYILVRYHHLPLRVSILVDDKPNTSLPNLNQAYKHRTVTKSKYVPP